MVGCFPCAPATHPVFPLTFVEWFAHMPQLFVTLCKLPSPSFLELPMLFQLCENSLFCWHVPPLTYMIVASDDYHNYSWSGATFQSWDLGFMLPQYCLEILSSPHVIRSVHQILHHKLISIVSSLTYSILALQTSCRKCLRRIKNGANQEDHTYPGLLRTDKTFQCHIWLSRYSVRNARPCPLVL